MQPILAESVSHRGRVLALIVALTFVAALAALAAAPRHARGHGHVRLRSGACSHVHKANLSASYIYVYR